MKIRQPRKSEMKALYEELKKYGDIPPSEAKEATQPSKCKQWLVVINNGKIVAGGRTYKTDWYEWTVKNGFVIPSARGRGIATKLWSALTDKAEQEGAMVAEADITSTNLASKMAPYRAGMRPVNSFKWDKKETHADIYQEVFMPPSKREVLSVNRKIRTDLTKRNVPVFQDILSPTYYFKNKKKR